MYVVEVRAVVGVVLPRAVVGLLLAVALVERIYPDVCPLDAKEVQKRRAVVYVRYLG